MATVTPVEYPANVQVLRERISQLPRLKEERRAILANLEQRRDMIRRGELSSGALEKPKEDLRKIDATIHLYVNEYPGTILKSLQGELQTELQSLRDRVKKTRAESDRAERAVTSAKDQLAESEGRLNRSRESEGHEDNKGNRSELLAPAKHQLKRALEAARGPEQACSEAEKALDAFIREHVWGLLT